MVTDLVLDLAGTGDLDGEDFAFPFATGLLCLGSSFAAVAVLRLGGTEVFFFAVSFDSSAAFLLDPLGGSLARSSPSSRRS